MKAEIVRKDALIQKHYDKLATWQQVLSRAQQGPPGGAQGTTGLPMGTSMQTQQGSTPQQQMPPQGASAAQAGTPTGPPSQHMGPPGAAANYPQGPLAYLEQTTSSIGRVERRN